MDFLTDPAVITPILVVTFHFLTAAGFWFYCRRHRRLPVFDTGKTVSSHVSVQSAVLHAAHFSLPFPFSVTAAAIISLLFAEEGEDFNFSTMHFLFRLHLVYRIIYVIDTSLDG